MEERALVTGGAGFIGSNLVRALLERGHAVRVLDDLSTGRPENLADIETDIELVRGDVRDRGAVDEAVRGVGRVFHQAAIPSVTLSVSDPASTHEVSATGTMNVLLAARDHGVERVVFASTSAVYGDEDDERVHEGLPPRPASPYGAAKLAAEAYLAAFHSAFGMATVALRYFNVFGPRQDPASEYAAVVPSFVQAALGHRAACIYGDGEQTRDFVYVGDVVRANLLASEAAEPAWGRAVNIAYDERHTVNELLSEIQAHVPGEHPPAVHEAGRPGEVRHSRADVSLARELLGYEATWSFSDALRATVEWFAGLA